MRWMAPFLVSPAKAAETLLYLATAPELALVSGRYFIGHHERKPHHTDSDAAARLWEISEQITARGT